MTLPIFIAYPPLLNHYPLLTLGQGILFTTLQVEGTCSRKLVARKFDGSKARRNPGRPRIKREVEQLVIAKENDWVMTDATRGDARPTKTGAAPAPT
jgi:hypothetical protein